MKQMYSYFYQVNDFTRRTGCDHNRVLVHCAMGMSRSATSVCMYLMRKFGMNFENALELVKVQRQKAEPNEGFVE